ncbi:retrovirus-related pol polyprotein from transposon TNT 1-94 [Tanacetum coccineum]
MTSSSMDLSNMQQLQNSKIQLHLQPSDRTYDELTDAEKIHEGCDIKATKIVLQGLPQDIYNLVNHHSKAKDIWDRVKLLIQGLVVLLFLPYNDPIASFNKAISFISIKFASQLSTHHKPALANLVLTQESEHKYQDDGYGCRQSGETKLRDNEDIVTTIQASQEIPTTAIFKTNDLDAFDSDCNEAPSASVILMAKLSAYDSNVLSEYSEQPPSINDSDIDITSDSNMIFYEQYLNETENAIVQDTNSSAQQDAMLMYVIDEMSIQVAKYNEVSKENKIDNESLTAELERYKEQIKFFKERQKLAPNSQTTPLPTPTSSQIYLKDREKYIDSQLQGLKALDEGCSSKNYVRKFLRALHPKWRAKVTVIEESKDLTSLSLDELIGNHKVHEMIIKKDSEIVKAKGERRSLSLKAKKESSDEECLTSGKCPKPPKDKNQRTFVGGSWGDSCEEDDENAKDETCIVAQASNEICLGVDLEPGEWIKDSGCSKYMTGNRMLFSTYKAYNGGNVIFGSNLRGQICNNKCRVTFFEHDSEITKDGKVTSKASKDLVRNLPRLKLDQHFYDACKIGKQDHSSHKVKNMVSMTRCLELLYMDLFGPSAVQSYGGNRYTLVIVDDYSRYTWTRFLKNKTKAFDQFEIFSKKIQN